MIMSRIIVEYNPPLSERVQKIIRNEITPSMISNDESSGQYEIDFVREKLVDNELEDDIKIIDELIEQGVHYIEI
jgi:hypothetical protein